MFSDEAVAMILDSMRERVSASNRRPRTPEWSPFRIESKDNSHLLFPPQAMPKEKKLRMAYDDALQAGAAYATTAWQAGGMFSNFASEGLLFPGYPMLAEMAQRPEYRLMAEIPAEEMTRKWTKLRGTDDESVHEKDKPKDRNADDEERSRQRERDGEKPRSDGRNKEIEEKIKELVDFEEELRLRSWMKDVAIHDRLFGIAHLLIDVKGASVDALRDPELGTPIGNGRDRATKEKLRGKGFLKGVRTVEPIWCYPTTYNAMNPLVESWYDPQVWYVMGAEIHKTRLLPFIGRPVPDMLKPAYAFGGLSMSQMAQPYVDIWLKTRMSVGELIHAFSVMVLSTELATTTLGGGGMGMNGDVLARVEWFNMLRDNMGSFVIDKKTEDFKNVSAPISGLDELQAQAQEHLFSVARIPAVKFAGIQPKGLNATSEGELRAFEETTRGGQEQLFRRHLTTLYDLMQLSLWGQRDPDITFDFEPLREMTEKEKGEIRKMEAETDQIRIDSGVLAQEEVRTKIANDPESGYDGIDPDDVPDLLGEEEEGLIPEGAGKGLEAELEEAEGAPAGKGRGGASDAVLPFVGDEAGFEESKHPRKSDGKFAPKGQGESGGGGLADPETLKDAEAALLAFLKNGHPASKAVSMLTGPEQVALSLTYGSGEAAANALQAQETESAPQFKSKKEHVGHLLSKGTTVQEVLKATGWPSVSMPQMAKSLGMKLEKVKEGGVTKYKGTPMTKEELAAAKQAAKAAKPDLQEQMAKATAIQKQAEAEVKKNDDAAKKVAATPPPEPSAFPPPTAQELEKAKKTVALQTQYVPGFGDLVSPTTTAMAKKLVEEFNAKYAGKEIAQGPALVQKVNDFKTLVGKVAVLNKLDAANKAAAEKEKAAKHAAEAATQAAKLKKAQEEHIAKNKAAMEALGITETEATGFNALVEMMGGTQADVIESFKKYEQQAKAHGYPISGFQYALIRYYINGGYKAINKALRSGNWSPQQHVYARLVNSAMDKMPKYSGWTDRGASLSAEDIAKYKPGMVHVEQSFTSSGIGYSFSGNVRFRIKASGKRGADFSGGANTVEKEVLFKAGTFFLVHKVEHKNGATHIEMEEIEGHG